MKVHQLQCRICKDSITAVNLKNIEHFSLDHGLATRHWDFAYDVVEDPGCVTVDMSDHEVTKLGKWGKEGPMMYLIHPKEEDEDEK